MDVRQDIFRNIKIRPSYGQGTALISWSFTADIPDGSVRVDRGNSGTGGWEPLNGERGEPRLTWYEDRLMLPRNELDVVHYRLLFFSEKHPVLISPSVGIFTQYSRQEFFLVKEITRREVLRLRLSSGLECLLYKRLLEGVRCDCVDSETGQAYGTSLCRRCFGTGLVDGYERPWRTYVSLMSPKKYKKSDAPVKSEPITFMAKLPGYPEPKPEDVVILPSSDDRYVVGTDMEVSLLRGNLPLLAQFPLLRLKRTDIRYQIPTPK